MVAGIDINVLNSKLPDSAVYFPGQTIEAEVVFKNDVQIHMKEMYVKFKGKAHTCWSKGDGKNSRTYSETEHYFKRKISFVDGGTACEDFILKPGTHTYPVSFTLPPGIPSSFGHGFGYVSYQIKTKAVPNKGLRNYRAKIPFTVISKVDLNKIGNATKPIQIQQTRTEQCCCFKTGPVTCMIRLDRRGYAPGESIRINAEVTNNSKSTILETVVSLRMITVFRAYDKRNITTKKLARVSHGRLEPGETDIWTGDLLQVRRGIAPSGLPGCSIIDPQYNLKLKTKMRGSPSLTDVYFTLPIIIGTIPLKELQPSTKPDHGRATSSATMAPLSGIATDDIMLENRPFVEPITTQPRSQPVNQQC